MIEELAEPLVAYARVALAQSAKKLFARGREHNRCGRGHALAFIKRPSARTQQWSVPATQQVGLITRREVVDNRPQQGCRRASDLGSKFPCARNMTVGALELV
jgi:hypothetical protein